MDVCVVCMYCTCVLARAAAPSGRWRVDVTANTVTANTDHLYTTTHATNTYYMYIVKRYR